MKKILRNKKVITTVIMVILILFIVVFGTTGCAFERDSDVSSYNVSKEE